MIHETDIYISIGLVKTGHLIFFVLNYQVDFLKKKIQQAGKCSNRYDTYCPHG